MTSPRLKILLAIMAVLVVARFVFPPDAQEAATVQPIVRVAQAPRLEAAGADLPRPGPSSVDESSADESDQPGNAFVVRTMPAPAVPPSPPSPPMVVAPPLRSAPVQAALVPPVAAAPPLQVIGTYDDGGPPAVFLATPSGTLIARKGSVLLAEYSVTGISAREVALKDVSTQRAFQLPIPGGGVR